MKNLISKNLISISLEINEKEKFLQVIKVCMLKTIKYFSSNFHLLTFVLGKY